MAYRKTVSPALLLSAAAVLWCFAASAAQTGRVVGIMKADMRLYVGGKAGGVTTAKDGEKITIDGLQPGTHKVSGKPKGGTSMRIEVKVEAGQTVTIDFRGDEPKVIEGEDAEGDEPENGGGGEDGDEPKVEPLPPGAKSFTNSLGMKMVLIPAGTYKMGEQGKTTATITKPFWMATCEVTNVQYEKFDPKFHRSSWGKDDNHPAAVVTGKQATAFCKWLNEREKNRGVVYRLPHEVEWEWAAHGGRNFKYPNSDSDDNLRSEANYYGTGGKDKWGKHAPVGSLDPNGYGLHDMIGNVKEWCCNKPFSLPAKIVHDPDNPAGTEPHKKRMMRGNSCWTGDTKALTVYYRITYLTNGISPKCGFRVAAVGTPR